MTRPFLIKLFLADGSPDGLKIAEKSNWVGRAIVCPRPKFVDVKPRADFAKPGVYLLVGPGDIAEVPRVYVGEGDPASSRIESHFRNKDFWTYFVLFTSKDDNLNKAHVQYLEARLLELARDANRSQLENGNSPQRPSLPEADVAEVEGFLDEMLQMLPVLGIFAFEKPPPRRAEKLTLFLRAKGLEAKGYEDDQGFIVLAGSQSPLDVVPSTEQYVPSVVEMRKSLENRGIFQRLSNHLVLTQDYVFSSPSAAASVMLARNANGRTDWKTAEGRSLKEIQEQLAN